MKMNSRFPTIGELFAADDSASLEFSDFDDALWLLLCDKITRPGDLDALPEAVGVYYSSRLLQWEVDNGGFAQAAFNVPEWFARAADGYEALGKKASARLIRKASGLLASERNTIERTGLLGATIGKLFAHFRGSRMSDLDDEIGDVEWCIDEERVAYARSNRDAFLRVK